MMYFFVHSSSEAYMYTREQLLKIKDLTFQTAIDEALVHEASREDSKELSQNKTTTPTTTTKLNE